MQLHAVLNWEINYSKRKKWFSRPDRIAKRRSLVFETSFNCSHVDIKNVILNTCQTLVLLLVTNQLTHQHIYVSNIYIFFICNTTYKNIQYTTLLTLLAQLTTQDYITFSFPFTHTKREKNEKKLEKNEKEGKDTTYYICILGTSR